jgi:hypothetical protein
MTEEYGLMRTRISNRKKRFQPVNALLSSGYTMSKGERWDTTEILYNKTASRADSHGANKSLKRSALRLHCPLCGPQARAAA